MDKNNYSVDVELSDDFSGYLYLRTGEDGNDIDSTLVKNRLAKFRGIISKPELGSFATNVFSATDKAFYIEPGKLYIKISIREKVINDYTLDWIQIDTLYGTPLARAQNNFAHFVYQNKDKSDWGKQLFSELHVICEQYGNTRYPGDLLMDFRTDPTLSTSQWKSLYEKLNHDNLSVDQARRIRALAFPNDFVEIGKPMFDFELINNEGRLVNTGQYRGDYLLIDFWASWCKPCRESFPKVKEIYDLYATKGLSILSVSLDEGIEEWHMALKKEELPWENVVDTFGFEGDVAEKYQLFGIPQYLIIDPRGTVLKTFRSIEDVQDFLQSVY